MSADTRSRLANAARRAAWVAFAALIVLSPLRARITLVSRPTAPVYADYTDLLLFWSDVAGLAVIACWTLSLVARHRPVNIGPRFLYAPMAVLLAISWIGVPFAVDPALAAITATRFTVLAALALYTVNEVGSIKRVIPATVLMVVVQAAVGIGQVVTQRSIGLDRLGEHALSPSMAVSVVTAGDGTRFLRAYGLADHPNILGGLLAMALLLIGGTGAQRFTVWRGAVMAAGAAALLLTFSRGAWLALAIGLVIVAAMRLVSRDRASVRRVALMCGCGALGAIPFVMPYQTALAARADPAPSSVTERRSVDERLTLAGATARIVAAHPVLGTGIGTVPLAMRAADPSFRYQFQPAHVVILDVAAETGMVGGAAYLVVLVAPWLGLWRHRRRWTPELTTASAALAAVSMVGLFDHYTWSYPAGRIWAWIVLALWAVAYRRAMSGAADAA